MRAMIGFIAPGLLLSSPAALFADRARLRVEVCKELQINETAERLLPLRALASFNPGDQDLAGALSRV
jgi:hypothetical protein